jgi:hypothetical protein
MPEKTRTWQSGSGGMGHPFLLLSLIDSQEVNDEES